MQPELHGAGSRATQAALCLSMARNPGEVREAQRLRYRVFVEEMGARLPELEPGIEQDRFDPFCEHLLVREQSSLRVVGTYRLLLPEVAMRLGSSYADGEFDLARLRHIRSDILEVGRACIDREFRNGAVITMLWSGLACVMLESRYGHLLGCASISTADGGAHASALYHSLARTHLAPPEYRVEPRNPLRLEAALAGEDRTVPPLLKGYLRAGSWIAGEPAWDPDFNTADLPVLLPLERIEARYARRYLGTARERSSRFSAPTGL